MATLSTAARTARSSALNTQIGASGKLKVYQGTTLLGVLTCSATFGTVANGVLTANAITQDASADASGIADKYEVTTSADVVVITGTASEAGGGGELILNDTSIVAGGTISVTSFVITEAA